MKEIDKELLEAAQEALLALSEYTILDKHVRTLDRLALAIQDFEVRMELSDSRPRLRVHDAAP